MAEYLSNRFGPGRFRLTPRSEHGTKLPGTQSLSAIIDEDTSMHVTMNSAPTIPTPTPISGIDGETAIEIERMRLQAEIERERKTRRWWQAKKFRGNSCVRPPRSHRSVMAVTFGWHRFGFVGHGQHYCCAS